jgi:pSer/pThr/pTyr-binding forkhead associated (FHA) protein
VPEALLTLLKLSCLALLYLFFFRVLRAVWAEVTPVRTAPIDRRAARADGRDQGRSRRGRRTTHLVVVEPRELKGRSYDLGEELTVGRAAGCQVTLDDSYVSQLHARVYIRDGELYVEDLGSTNGTYLNTRKVSSPSALRRGDQLKVGSTVLEVKG